MFSLNGKQTEVEWSQEEFIRPNLPSKCTWAQKDAGDVVNPHIKRPVRDQPKVFDNILQVIGNTPLVRLNNIPKSEGLKCDLLVKCEFLNPGGSLKDRIGYRMVEDCEEKGLIQPGCTLIEPTSGNTGIGIAMAAAVKGYKCIMVMPEKMSDEKVRVLQALGAEIIRTPTEAAFDSPDSLISVSQKLQKKIPNSYILDQYRNEANPLAHYDGTGAEIAKELDGQIDMVVIGTGTGGTVCGVGRYMRDHCPSCVVVAADPFGSILAQPSELNESDVQIYEVEGVGYDFVATVLDRSVVDKWIKTDDKESLTMSRRLIREEGLLCGGSSGAVVSAAIKAARELKEGQKCVVILADNIRNYMGKFVSDSWMVSRNFMEEQKPLSWWNKTVADMKLPRFRSSVRPTLKCRDAINVMKIEKSDVLIITNLNNDFHGYVTDSLLMQKLIDNKCTLNDYITVAASKKIIRVSPDTHLSRVSRILENERFTLVQNEFGEILAKITRMDLLHFIKDSCK